MGRSPVQPRTAPRDDRFGEQNQREPITSHRRPRSAGQVPKTHARVNAQMAKLVNEG